MSANPQGQSATIHQFPARGRFAQSGRREHVQPVAALASAQMTQMTSLASSGWYHDEAIRDERPRKN